MDFNIIQVACVSLGLILVASNFISTSSVINWCKNLLKPRPPAVKTGKSDRDDFMEVVNNWHALKESCHLLGMEEACKMLDDVFPLLNKKCDGHKKISTSPETGDTLG